MDILSGFLSPLMGRLGEFVPDFVGALVILLLGWLVARLARKGTYKLSSATGVSEKASGNDGTRSSESYIDAARAGPLGQIVALEAPR